MVYFPTNVYSRIFLKTSVSIRRDKKFSINDINEEVLYTQQASAICLNAIIMTTPPTPINISLDTIQTVHSLADINTLTTLNINQSLQIGFDQWYMDVLFIFPDYFINNRIALTYKELPPNGHALTYKELPQKRRCQIVFDYKRKQLLACCDFSENKRWVLLKDVNDNILEFRRTLGDNIGDFVANNDENEDEKLITAITYSEADVVVSDYKCSDIPYPRICRQEIITDYFISIGMSNDTTTFDMCYSDGTKYFGIGFGDKGMNGDAIIYTTGKDNADTANVYDYFLKGKGVSLVTKDVTDDIDTNSVQTNIVDGLFCVTFQRDFDTEDPDDHVFSGTEQSINIWYAVGSSSLALSQHGHIMQNMLKYN